MILNIRKSNIFKTNPAERFAKEYQLPFEAWNEVWRRYKLLEYSHKDIKDYLFIKYARNLNPKSIDRWILRTEVYGIASPLIEKGVEHVNSEIFKQYEQQLMDYLFQTMKSSGQGQSRIII
jgi:hypothetical protein